MNHHKYGWLDTEKGWFIDCVYEQSNDNSTVEDLFNVNDSGQIIATMKDMYITSIQNHRRQQQDMIAAINQINMLQCGMDN